MRFVMAIVAFVVAAALVVLGFAQRTILLGPDSVAESVSTSAAPLTLIGGDALSARAGRQSLLVTGSGTVFAAYGRTADVLAWVGDAAHNVVSVDAETGELVAKSVQGTEDVVPDPRGSDLWLEEFSQESWLRSTLNLDSGYTVLIASDGTRPAPSAITISWPLDNSTPWAGPLILGGIVIALVGVGIYLWALQHLRRSRGPRRKTPKLPKPPAAPRYKPSQLAIDSTPARGRRSARKPFTAIVALGVTTVLLSGCSAAYWPDLDNPAATESSPKATESTTADIMFPPAVTVPQLEAIVARVATVINDADSQRNVDLLTTRAAGPTLELRQANYAIRGADSSVAPLAAVSMSAPTTVLPQATDSWPRTVMAVLPDADPAKPQQMMVLLQDSPRQNYRLHYLIALANKQEVPFASAMVGAPVVPPDSTFTVMAPEDVAPAYGEILMNGSSSAFYDLFDNEKDSLQVQFGAEYKAGVVAALPPEAVMSFGDAAQTGLVLALATGESGAVVATNVNEYVNVTPKAAGGTVSPAGQVKALSGLASSTRGIQATYGYQLLFFVPPVTENGKIVLLGYTQGLVAAKEL